MAARGERSVDIRIAGGPPANPVARRVTKVLQIRGKSAYRSALRHRVHRSSVTRGLPERRVQPLDQVGCQERQLLGPDGRPAAHRDRPRRARRRARASAAIAAPDGVRPGALDGGQRGQRLEPARPAPRPPRRHGRRRRSGALSARSAGAHRSCGGRLLEHRAVGHRDARRRPAALAPGHVREVGRRDERLAARADPRRRAARAGRRRARSSRRRAAAAGRRRAPAASASRSASSSARSASRCSPCDP